MCSKMDDIREEEQIFASPNTVYSGCQVLDKKIVFYEKKISGPRKSKSKLDDSNQCKLYFILHRSHLPFTLYSFNALLIGPK